MTFCECEGTTTFFIPALGKGLRIKPTSENGICTACGRSRRCEFCQGAAADAAHNTIDMHLDFANGGTGCPTVPERSKETR